VIKDTVVLFNARGERVELSPLGAGITGIYVRDRQGRVGDVSVDEGGSAGKVVGRYANRIAGARFALDGRVYQLAANEGANTLHGGPDGFTKRTWKTGATRTSIDGSTMSVEFSLNSPAGDQGFPGNLGCNVVYSFDDEAALRIAYGATSDAPTVVNLTNHVYFNLSGSVSPSIATQQLWIASDEYTPVDRAMIPTGEISPIAGTVRDFRKMRPIGNVAFDCNFVLDAFTGDLRVVAEAFDDASGRQLRVETTEPGLQLYTGKGNAFALETQHFPDSPNHPNFPSTALRPGQHFKSTTVYRFTTSD
jgi:aldose 1-epimerase